MSELPNPNDIYSKEARLALTKMVMKLFTLWQLTTADQAILLNRSLSSVRRYQKGGCFADGNEIFDRVGYLLRIHKYLRMLYPHNPVIIYRWVSADNKAFAGKPALEVMKQGFAGLKTVSIHLNQRLDE